MWDRLGRCVSRSDAPEEPQRICVVQLVVSRVGTIVPGSVSRVDTIVPGSVSRVGPKRHEVCSSHSSSNTYRGMNYRARYVLSFRVARSLCGGTKLEFHTFGINPDALTLVSGDGPSRTRLQGLMCRL